MNGVGPAREEKLKELGYETYEELASADPETLAEDISRLSGDTALSIVVQAENMTDLEKAEVEEQEASSEGAESDSEPVEQEADADPSYDTQTLSDSSDGTESESNDESDTISVTLAFGSTEEYDTLYNAVYEGRNTALRTNRFTEAEEYEELLDAMRPLSSKKELEYEMSADALNNLHQIVSSTVVTYQGENLTDQMNALKSVQKSINAIREEELF